MTHPGHGDSTQPGYGQYGGTSYGGQGGAPPYGAAYGTPAYGSPYGGPGHREALKPGVVPLRPLGLAEILDGTITTMRRYPRPTFALSAVLAAIGGLLALLQNVTLVSDTSAAFVTSVGATVLGVLVGLVSTVLLAGALALVLSEGMLGRPVTTSQVWARLRPRVAGLVGLALLTGLLVMLGLVVLIVGAVVVGVFLLLAAPAYVLEGATVTGALRRSVTLVRGSWWRVFGIYLLMALLVTLVSAVLLVPLGVAGAFFAFSSGAPEAELGTGASLALVLVSTLLSVVTAPVSAYVVGLLYVDQRMRREGLDLQLAQAAGLRPEPLQGGYAGGGYGEQPQYGGQYGQPQYGGQYGQPRHDEPQYGGEQQAQPRPDEEPPSALGWSRTGDEPRRDEGWSTPPR